MCSIPQGKIYDGYTIKYNQDCKESWQYIQNKEKNQSVETDPEMTQMAKDKDIN